MAAVTALCWQHLASNGSPRLNSRTETGGRHRRAAHPAQRGGGGAAAGIGVRTLLRWLKLPEFQSAYRQARRDAFGQAIARLQQGTSAAATTLLKVMIDPGAPASVRVRAADSVLNHATKAIEIEDIEARGSM